jgi:hypothetical protein
VRFARQREWSCRPSMRAARNAAARSMQRGRDLDASDRTRPGAVGTVARELGADRSLLQLHGVGLGARAVHLERLAFLSADDLLGDATG